TAGARGCPSNRQPFRATRIPIGRANERQSHPGGIARMVRNASERRLLSALATRSLCVVLAVLAAACAGTRDPARPQSGPLPAPPRASDGVAYVSEKHPLA